MRIAETNRDITRIGLSEQGSFGIKATGKAFRILSSSLYRDKIMAIVRELCCNALDSHVAAGCADRPIYVGLPNALSPHFLVRDYGTGMTHKEMMGLYTTYFDSTKIKRDDQIGALGLGSKAPFSYTDCFTVTAWDGRWRRDYCAFIAEDGTPSLALLSKQRDKTERGIQVLVPVPRVEDHEAFALRASVILGRFSPEPIVEGKADFEFARRKVKMSGTNWRMCHRHPAFEALGLGGTAMALMGPVAYPITGVPLRHTTAQKLADVAGLEIDFPMGAVDIMAGREDLSYDTDTIAVVTKTLLAVMDEFEQAAQIAVDECATEFDARVKYGELISLPVSFQNQFTFRGKPLTSSSFERRFEANYPNLTVSFITARSGKAAITDTRNGGLHSGAFAIPTKAPVFLNDLARGGRGRALKAYHTSMSQPFILVDGPRDVAMRFLSEMEGLPYRLTSELPPLVRGNSSLPSTSRDVTVHVLSIYLRSKIRKSDWTTRQIALSSPPEGALVMPIMSYAPILNGARSPYSGTHLQALQRVGIWGNHERLFGTTQAQMDRLLAAGVKDFWAVCKSRIAQRLLTDETLAHRLRQHAAGRAARIQDLSDNGLVMLGRVADLLPQGHPLRICGEGANQSKIDADAATWIGLIKLFALDLREKHSSRNHHAYWQDVSRGYPLLRTLLQNHTSAMQIADYVLMIDTHNRNTHSAAA